MAWLPAVRRQWQTSAFRLAKKAANGSNQFSSLSSSLVDPAINNIIFNPQPSVFSSNSFPAAGPGLQGLLINNSIRSISAASKRAFTQAVSLPVTADNGTQSEIKEKTESETVKKGRNSGFPKDVPCLPGLEPTKPGAKARIVVLGTGWAGCSLMKGLDTKIYDVVCISPRNHMVFTPLLASTCVGTLEFRSVAEPVSRIQPALSRSPNSYFLLAVCNDVDTDNHEIYCETVEENGSGVHHKWQFKVAYDKLIIASGAEASTFGIHGVMEHAIFLREVYHAQEIRQKLLLNLMLSEVPGISEGEKKRLLHCVVVGGGPTGVEFSGELSDFIIRDVHERYCHVKDYIHVTLIEANEILSSFDVSLREYAIKHLTKSGVQLVRGVVKDVQSQKILLNDGTEVPYGLLVWSTGVGPSPFSRSLKLPKSPGGRIGVDEWLRAPSAEDVYAIGDCCGFLESTSRPTLPALAQVAERQGKYLAGHLNRIGRAGGGRAGDAEDIPMGNPFVYKHLASMATVGRYKALVDLRQSKEAKGISMAGFASWLMWRSAYLSSVLSWRSRFYVAVNWTTTFVFGRDISRL